MNNPMPVKLIVELYILNEEFDGLFNSDGECGCLLGDIAPCGEMSQHCEAGYKRKCDCGDDHAFHVCREREDS